MLSPQQNLPQQKGPNHNEGGSYLNSFSIRQYVLAAREKDVSCNWPFPEKYLRVCQKHGISNLLPTLEPLVLATNQSHKEGLSLNYTQEEIINADYVISIDGHKENIEGCDLNSEVSSQACNLSLSSDICKHKENNSLSSDIVHVPGSPEIQLSTTTPSLHPHFVQSTEALTSTKRSKHKQRKCKRKRKKRSMVDIFAVAKRCTLEGMDGINELGCGSMNYLEVNREGGGQLLHVEHGRKSKVTDGSLRKHPMDDESLGKHEIDDNEASHSKLSGNKRLILKIKLR